MKQWRIAEIEPREVNNEMRPVSTESSASEDHCISSMNKTSGRSERATQVINFRTNRKVRLSASDGPISIFWWGKSSLENSFSRTGTNSTSRGRSLPRAEDKVFLKKFESSGLLKNS